MEVFKEVVEKKNRGSKREAYQINQVYSWGGKGFDQALHPKPSAEGYENAIELLESRYGDPLKILASYQREI